MELGVNKYCSGKNRLKMIAGELSDKIILL